MNDELDDFIDEILVDAHGEHEQLTAFEQAFHDFGRFPMKARIVGAHVEVTRVEFEGDERRGLTAVCRRDGESYRVALADLVPGPLTVETARLLAAYRRWLGLPDAGGARCRSTGHPMGLRAGGIESRQPGPAAQPEPHGYVGSCRPVLGRRGDRA